MEEKIFGINPVLEALKAQPERFQEIFLPAGTLKGKKGLIHSLARSHNIKIQRIPRSRFEHLVGNEVHQGVVGTVLPYSYRPLEALLESWRRSQERALFVLLDGVEDPQNLGAIARVAEDPRNLGAIARTANTAGAHGIIVPKHRSAPMNAAAAKAAAGAFSYTPVCRITNLVNTIKILKKEGVWVIGAAESADLPLYDHDFNADIAVVIGRERTGLSNEELELCNGLVHIPTSPEYSSLNVAAAVQVLCYELRLAFLSNQDAVVDKTRTSREDMPATTDQLEGMYQHMYQMMQDIQFFSGSNPEVIMRRLKSLFNRAHVTKREVAIMRGIFSAAQGKKSARAK